MKHSLKDIYCTFYFCFVSLMFLNSLHNEFIGKGSEVTSFFWIGLLLVAISNFLPYQRKVKSQ